jgi:lipopolysaccharide export system protein LptC
MSTNNENDNVFRDFGSWFKTAKMRSPDTNLDEARIFIMVIFWGVTFYILGTGLYYHYEIFKVASNSGWFAIAISATIFIIGEFGKYKLFTVFLWGLFSGDFSRSLPKLGAYSIMAILITGFYIWSWNISTNAAPTLNSLINKTSNMATVGGDSSSIKDLEAQLAGITAQMNDAAAKETKGFGVKYKGVVTQDGQAIAKKNATLKTNLADQQAQIRTELMAVKSKMNDYKTSQFDLAANQLSEYGGYGELAQLLLLLINSLILMEMYDRNRKGNSKATPSVIPAVSGAHSYKSAIAPASTEKSLKDGKYMYLQGYIFVKVSDRYYNPSEFLVWLRNSHKRGNTKVVDGLRKDLLEYFKQEHIDPKIIEFCGKYKDIVGDEVVNTVSTKRLAGFEPMLKTYVLHEAGHFVAYCYLCKNGIVKFTPTELVANPKKNKGYFSHSTDTSNLDDKGKEMYVLFILAGLAVEYTQDFDHTQDDFFHQRVEPFANVENSDTKNANDLISTINKAQTLEDYFYEAVDLMLEYQDDVYEVSKRLGMSETLNAKELTQIAHDLKLIP